MVWVFRVLRNCGYLVAGFEGRGGLPVGIGVNVLGLGTPHLRSEVPMDACQVAGHFLSASSVRVQFESRLRV